MIEPSNLYNVKIRSINTNVCRLKNMFGAFCINGIFAYFCSTFEKRYQRHKFLDFIQKTKTGSIVQRIE